MIIYWVQLFTDRNKSIEKQIAGRVVSEEIFIVIFIFIVSLSLKYEPYVWLVELIPDKTKTNLFKIYRSCFKLLRIFNLQFLTINKNSVEKLYHQQKYNNSRNHQERKPSEKCMIK